MSDISIQVAPLSSPFIPSLEALFQSQWSDFSFRGYSKSLPVPIIALNSDVHLHRGGETVIGGLAYTYFTDPQGSDEVVWINALAVANEHRRQGVASLLITRAVEQLSSATGQNNQTRLYVYTNIPSAYLKLGWQPVLAEAEPDHQVLSFDLTQC